MSIKQSWKPMISFCTNDVQKERGTAGLLYILELFVLTVTNSSSLENVVTQDFDTSCTNWLVMFLSAVVILYWSIYGCTLALVSAQVCRRAQLARYAPCASQPRFWWLCWCTHHLDWELQNSDLHLKSNKTDSHLKIQSSSSKCIQLKHFCCSKNALTSRAQMKAL